MFKRLKRKGKKGKLNLSNVKQKIDPSTVWNVGEKIGEGAMGQVFRVTNESNTTTCAGKILTIESKDDIEEFVIEVDALTVCKHVNIVRLYDAIMFNKKFWVVLEYCAGGAFDDLLIARNGEGLSEPQVQSCAKQLLSAISHLHNLGVYHRDIKGSNLLLNEQGVIKLTDFGSCSLNNQPGNKRDTFLGSPYWMAPEIVACDNPGKGGNEGYDGKADVWAYGITIIELAQCDPPYQDLHPMRAMLKIVANPAPTLDDPHVWSDDLFEFIENCLVKEQDYRKTAAELFHENFVQGPPDYNCLIPLMSHSNIKNVLTPSEMLAEQLKSSAIENGFELNSDGDLTQDDEEETFGWG